MPSHVVAVWITKRSEELTTFCDWGCLLISIWGKFSDLSDIHGARVVSVYEAVALSSVHLMLFAGEEALDE